MMNKKIVEKDRSKEALRRIEKIYKQNSIEKLDINLDACGSNIIFSKKTSILFQEGKVEIQLDRWIQGRYNKIKNQLEYKVSFPMKYLSSETLIAGSFYDKIYSSKELESDSLINEIVDKTMKLLNKKELDLSDFNGVRATAEVIHCKDEHGNKYSKLINIDVYKNEYKSYSEPIKKNVLEKKYNELDESDEDETQAGFSITDIKKEVDKISAEVGEESVGISNLAQELGIIHTREENRQTGKNFISLFYYDKANKRLLVLEPTIYEIKSYRPELIKDIATELMDELLKINKEKMEISVE